MVAGAVIEKLSEYVPLPSWLGLLKQVTAPGGVSEMRHPVERQFWFPPALFVVTLTDAVMDAPPATVTLVPPFSVAELTIRLEIP